MTFKDLKVGDKVFAVNTFYKKLRQVEKITPTGLIRVGGRLYNQNGSLRSSDTWNTEHLEIANDDTIEKFKEEVFVNKCKSRMSKKVELTYSQAKRIMDILDESEKIE